MNLLAFSSHTFLSDFPSLILRQLIMQSFMAPFWSFSAIFFFLALITSPSSSSLASPQSIHISTISAAPAPAPATSPGAPLVSTPLSPDMEPLFPSPGGAAYSPSDSSFPTIPANPSPPNPDVLDSPGPAPMAFPPSESMPAYAPASHSSSLPLNLVLYHALLLICLMQHLGM